MSSTTENLGLTLPAGSEWADVTVLNENWEKIDRQVLRAMAAAAAYDAGKTYQKGDFCTQGGLLYRANRAIAQPEAWTAGHWTAISITDVIRGLTAEDVGAVPTTEKGTAGGVATLGSNGQVPYAQTPHLTGNVTLYADADAGSDTNPGTQQAPFRTIQAAINSLPKSLDAYTATIRVKDGNYEETVDISGFSGGLERVYLRGGALCIISDNYDTPNVVINGNVNIDSSASPVFMKGLEVRGTLVSCGPTCLYQCKIVSTGDRALIGGRGILKVESCEIQAAAYSAATDSIMFMVDCTIGGDYAGIAIGSYNPKSVGLVAINDCTITAPTKIAKYNNSIIFENGVQV